MYEFTNEMFFDEKILSNKGNKDKSPMRLLQSPGIMASGISTEILPQNEEVCERIKLILHEKQAG